MILLLIVPVYLFLNYYVIRRIFHWLHLCSPHLKNRWFTATFVTLYALAASSLLFAFLLPSSGFQAAVRRFSNYWLGTFLYILLAILTADLIRLLLKYVFHIPEKFFRSATALTLAGILAACLVLGGSFRGAYNAHRIHTTDYEVDVAKSCAGRETLTIVLLSDLHLGYSITSADVARMTEKINEQNPDLVCIAGDIFDNEYDALDDPDRICELLSSIRSAYGTYACWGNHDISEKLLGGFSLGTAEDSRDPRMEELLTRAGIHLLADEAVLIDNAFYMAGRLDRQKPLTEDKTRLSPEELLEDLDPSKPMIVLDHQPKELQELADAGADLALGGHTHNGQLFPGNLAIRLFWENPYGHLQKDQMHSIVTSGTGVWGPAMRIGTKSEICRITVNFKNS